MSEDRGLEWEDYGRLVNDVLRLKYAGKTNRDIGKHLRVPVGWVETISNAMVRNHIPLKQVKKRGIRQELRDFVKKHKERIRDQAVTLARETN